MTISFNTIPANAKASNVFVEAERARAAIETTAFLPQKLSLIGQYDPAQTGVTDYVPRQLSSAAEFASFYGSGSMLHLMALKAFQNLGAAGIPVFAHPVPEDGGATASTGTIEIVGDATSAGVINFRFSNQVVSVQVANGDLEADIASALNAAIAAKLSLPVTSTVLTDTVTVTSKWKGITANDIDIAVFVTDQDQSQKPTGVAIVITPVSGGTVNPDTTNVFPAMGDVWFTRIVFAFSDAANLAVLDAAGDARHLSTVNKTMVPILGDATLVSSISTFITFVDALNSPWHTFVWRDTRNLPFEIAAAAGGKTVVRAQSDPGRPYNRQTLDGIEPRELIDGLSYQDKNDIQLAGGSVTVVNDNGETEIMDLNTTEKTDDLAQPLPNWQTRTVVWSNVQAKIFSLVQLLTSPPFVAAVIVNDDQVTAKDFAVSPKRLKGALTNLIDQVWILNAWSKNRDLIVASILTEIDTLDPERLNAELTDDHAVGLRLLPVLYKFASSSEF